MARSAVCLVLCVAVAIRAEGSKCFTPGALVCDANCKNLVVCLGEPEGADNPFREESVETCAAGTHCYSPSRRCESRSSCEAEYEFECTTLGQLPHPDNCRKYFVCVPDSSTSTGFIGHEQDCRPGYAYNSSLGYCNIRPLSHPTCLNGPVPLCKKVGAFGSLPENPSIYYVCKRRDGVLLPVLFLCKHGGVFDKAAGTCLLATKA